MVFLIKNDENDKIFNITRTHRERHTVASDQLSNVKTLKQNGTIFILTIENRIYNFVGEWNFKCDHRSCRDRQSHSIPSSGMVSMCFISSFILKK